MLCSACGAQVPEAAGFCSNCGTRLSSAASQSAPVAAVVGIEHFDFQTSAPGLFFRVLGACLGMMLVIPAPWIVCWLARWFISQVRVEGQSRLSFRGSPSGVAPLAIAFGVAIVVVAIPGSDDGLHWWQILTNIAMFPLGYLWVRWFVNNTVIAGSPFHFDGSFWGYMGRIVLMYASFITIIGWGWGVASYYRWLAKHSQTPIGELRFAGRGHQLLWRTIVCILFFIPVVTMPWAVRWFVRWLIQQCEFHGRTV